MDIPTDVLFIVMNLVGAAQDIVSLMTTCKALKHEGMKRLLSRGVVLRDSKDIESFHHFITADSETRYPLFQQSLTIMVGGIPLHISSLLLDVLSNASHLERLTLSLADGLLQADPRLTEAIVNIPRLKKIHLQMIRECEQCLDTLRRLWSPCLSHVHIAYHNDPLGRPRNIRREWEMPRDARVPFLLLSGVRSSLEVLEGQSFQPEAESAGTYPKFLSVRTLILHDLNRLHLLEPYIVACPQLKSLIFPEATVYQQYWLCPSIAHAVLFIRGLNRTYQEVHGSWPKLERVCGSLEMLYSLGLTCPVNSLRLVMRPLAQSRADWLCEVVEEIQPTHLCLETTDLHNVTVCLSALATCQGTSRIAHLEICMLKALLSDWDATLQWFLTIIKEPPFPEMNQLSIRVVVRSSSRDTAEGAARAYLLDRAPFSRQGETSTQDALAASAEEALATSATLRRVVLNAIEIGEFSTPLAHVDIDYEKVTPPTSEIM